MSIYDDCIPEPIFGHAELVTAANPYGCNQYGEGWKKPHNGRSSRKGHPTKKTDEARTPKPGFDDDEPFAPRHNSQSAYIQIAPDGTSQEVNSLTASSTPGYTGWITKNRNGKITVVVETEDDIDIEVDSPEAAIDHLPVKVSDVTRKKIIDYFKKPHEVFNLYHRWTERDERPDLQITFLEK